MAGGNVSVTLNTLFNPQAIDQRDSVLGQVDAMNQLALGPAYVPRDPQQPTISAGASPEPPMLSLRPNQQARDRDGTVYRQHIIHDRDGNPIGDVDTTYSPGTQTLHVGNVNVDGGAGSIGARGVIFLRDLLRQMYPEATTITGERISGANPNREAAAPLPPGNP